MDDLKWLKNVKKLFTDLFNFFKNLYQLGQKVQDLEERVKILESKLNKKGVICPYCESRNTKASPKNNSFVSSFQDTKSFICNDCNNIFSKKSI